MIHIRKWICILVLIIICLITIDEVNAVSYNCNPNHTIATQYHDLFNNVFSGRDSYLYFSYSCNFGNTDRNCWYGIDSKNNYYMVDYQQINGSWVVRHSRGIDNNFSVNGGCVIRKEVNDIYVLLNSFVFFGVFAIVSFLFYRSFD